MLHKSQFVCQLETGNWDNLNSFNTLRPGQNGRHFADDTFNRIFVNENVRISIKFSLKFVPKGPINNIPALVQIMARPGDKPLSETAIVILLTHICVTRPQSVKDLVTASIIQWTGSPLVQIMAYHLIGAKPLPGLIETYCQLGPSEQVSVKL